jgi:hypothetical protein
MSGGYAEDPLTGKMDSWLGLQLASGLTAEATSYYTFVSLRGKVRSIIVYDGLAITAADAVTARYLPDPIGGYGRPLMQALADMTLADVIAPDTQQSSQTQGDAWDLIRGRPWTMDYGAWEGQLWRYSPNQKRPVPHDV